MPPLMFIAQEPQTLLAHGIPDWRRNMLTFDGDGFFRTSMRAEMHSCSPL
jgi:hypothetical protein